MDQAVSGDDPYGLSKFDISQLLMELARRGNAAMAASDIDEAERLFRAVVAYAPNHVGVLRILGELALARTDWPAAIAAASHAIELPLTPQDFGRNSAIYCCASLMQGGEAAARAAFAAVKDKLTAMVKDSPPDRVLEDLDIAMTCSIAAGDHSFSHELFHRRFVNFISADAETAISCSTTVRSWCEANGASFQVIEPVKHISSQGLSPQHGSWDYMTQGVNLAVIPDGEMLAGLDFVVTAAGELLVDSGHIAVTSTGWFPCFRIPLISRIHHLWPRDVTFIDEDALFLSCSQGWHVGHWIVDFLPRLRALKEHPYLKVATVTELPPKNRDLLALFGIDHDRIINCDLGRRYRFRSLAVVQTGDPVHPDPNNICFVTDFLRTQGRPASAPLRLFLERDLKNRSITNRDDLSAELERRGFRRLSLSTMSIAEQRTALSAAEIVIATYGSDLQAFYMMSEGANLVELNWDPVAMDAGVAAMCSMVGVKYHVIRCEAAEAAEYRAYKKDRDFAVDMDALCQLLDRLDFQRRV